jgi:HEAT repeat protein
LLIGVTAVAAPGITASAPVTPASRVGTAGSAAIGDAQAEAEADSVLLERTMAVVDTPDTIQSRLARELAAARARLDAARARSLARVELLTAGVRAPRALAIAGGMSWSGGRQAGDTTSIAVPALIAALRDPDVQVRRAAAGSLSNLEDPRAIPALIEALKDSDAEVRACAAQALGSFEDKRAVPGLVALVKDGNKDVRTAALSSLHAMASEVPDEAILSALNDGDAEVRQSAIGLAMNRISERQEDENYKPDPRYQSAFVRLLTDPSRDVRQEAISALGELRLTEAPSALFQLASDKDPEVRQAVVNTLGQIGDARGVPTLRSLLQDPSAEVRESAVNALSQVRDRTALEALVGALKSSDPSVRRAAAEALGQREN